MATWCRAAEALMVERVASFIAARIVVKGSGGGVGEEADLIALTRSDQG